MATASQQPVPPPPQLIFWFDIVCPHSWIAANRIEEIGKFAGAEVIWTPVSLGGLYRLSEAPQGADGSATDVYNSAKQAIVSADFLRECKRYQLDLKFPPRHPLKTIDAGRLITAFPAHHRNALGLALYKAYWVDHLNIESRQTLLRIARNLRFPSNEIPTLDETLFLDSAVHNTLRSATKDAFSKGAFGVPSFWIPEASAAKVGDAESEGKRGRFFHGQDRLHLVEAELLALRMGKRLVEIPHLGRLHPRCLRTPPEDRRRTLTVWYDFSSPFSFLAWTQLERIQREAGEFLTIELKPFVLGALFKAIGAPMVPMEKEVQLRRQWMAEDIGDWSRFWTAVNAQEYPPLPPVAFRWPNVFPVNSVNALRVAIINPLTVPTIFRAAFSEGREIGKPEILAEILSAAGFAGEALVKRAKEDEAVKKQLRENTEQAVQLGFCGAPTFQIGKHVVWGQDRLNVVEDLIAGWRPNSSHLKASVGSFPYFDYRL